MKAFKFTLQTLHDLREREREEAEQALAQATATLNEAIAQVEQATRRLNETVKTYSSQLQVTAPDPREAEMYTHYIITLENQLAAACSLRDECDQQREFRMSEVVKASAAAEATAKLREQYYSRYVAELAREEQTLMDELATIATVRRTRESA